ncbi:MAG: HAD family hydrolase [Candidatus Zixiibacteriota bacterium]
MTSVDTLIFDLDGTLIDSSDGVVEAVNFALRQLGEAERSPDEIKPYIGYPLHKMFADFTDAPPDELYRQFQVRAALTIVASAVPLDGVESVLLELHRRGYRIAVATTKVRAHVDGILAKLGWTRFFEATVAGNEVPRFKPDPGAFLLALERLNARATQALVIGDTENDILAARAIPIRIAAVLSPYGGHDKVRALRPDYVIATLGELPNILSNRSREKG